jgi:ribosome-interacting GTPase 1
VDIVVREDVTLDEFIDVVEGNRAYIPCLYVYNKIDCLSIEELEPLATQPHTLLISCSMNINMDILVDKMWQ